MRGFVETLAQRHTVVHYDRPGVGLSGRAQRPYDLDAETDYLRTVVDATGAERVGLLGISCGGPASIRLAAEQPDRVSTDQPPPARRRAGDGAALRPITT